MLTFDAERHIYHWDGKPVPNVTRIIAPLVDLSMIPADALEKARLEGVAVHKMAQLYFEGKLDAAALYSEEGQAWLIPHYEALLKFESETGFECWKSEHQMYHRGLGYAGTTDLIGLMPKLKTVLGSSVVDIKRSLYGGPSIGLQLVAYRKSWNDGDGKAKELRIADRNRFALQLRKDGSYRLTQYDDPEDEVAFIACLQHLRWKERKYGSR